MNKAQEFLNIVGGSKPVSEKTLKDAEVKKARTILTKLSKIMISAGKEIDALKKLGTNGGNVKAADFVLGEFEDAVGQIEMDLEDGGTLGETKKKSEGMETAFGAMDKVWKSHKLRKFVVDYAGEKDAETFWSILQDAVANDEFKNISDLMKKAQREFDKHASDEKTD